MTLPGDTQMIALTVGDSITAAGKWQAELCRLCSLAGVVLDIRNVAVAGQRTVYWPDKIAGLLATHQPDLMTFFTGTNDDPAEVRFGEPATTWAWRSVIEAVHSYRTPPPAIVPAFIGYSDPLVAPDWLLHNEPIINDMIYGQYVLPRYAGWFAGLADFQKLPATPDYLDDGGIHPTDRGYAAMGRIVYDAICDRLGWPACPEPPLKGMYGHRKGYPRPAFVSALDG